MTPVSGKVYLVGAGPGDPQLLTLRGAELLRAADVVVYDSLVPAELLHLAPPGAELIARGAEPRLSQDELNALLADRARAGKRVVRLKGGDPVLFGRGGEEAESLAAAGVPFEIVPGVSSITAVPAYAGIPITRRNRASTLTVVTGHEDPGKGGAGVDWALLARTPGTKMILMGLERLEAICETLRAHGLDPGTPAAVISRGTTGRQRSVFGTLADIAARSRAAGLEPPAVIVFGEVAARPEPLNWFEARPLFGQRVVVTRARDQAEPLSARLRERGAEVLEVPCIKIAPPTHPEPLAEALAGLGSYDWVIFTSANGVAAFFEQFFRTYEDVRCLGLVRLAAVGPATAARLRELHLKVDLVPPEYVARDIVREMAREGSLENLRILLLRAEVANPELPRLLEDAGAIVDDIACYRTVAEIEDWSGAAARLTAEGAEWLTFASGSAARHFHERFNLPALRARFPGMRVASIGPETSKVLAGLGCAVEVEATPHTIEGLVEAIERAVTP
jgi:uroporphyrinogen III methyltransferase/synthase